METIEKIRAAIRDVPDFPKPGILFKDLTPLMADGSLLRGAIGLFVDACRELRPDKIVGIEARGFIFGSAVATALGCGFVPIRKKGKLPWKTHGKAYALEYGQAEIEIHQDAVTEGARVVLIDDLLATGGTACAAIELLRETGADLLEVQFLVELDFLEGRIVLGDVPVRSFLHY